MNVCRPSNLHRMLLGTAAVSIAVMVLSAFGCSATTATDGSPHDTSIFTDELSRLAAAEGGNEAPTRLLKVPVPPGVEPSMIVLRDDDDRDKALQSVREALTEIVARVPATESRTDVPATTGELNINQRAEAEVLYVRARLAGIEGNVGAAVQMLERARSIDPQGVGILRQLARSYAAMRNAHSATATYRDLLTLAPGDHEAVLAIAMHDTAQHRFEPAIASLAPIRISGDGLQHDSFANVLADYTLASAFFALGYDTAQAESLESLLRGLDTPRGPTAYRAQLESLERQRSDLSRQLGDALSRLGRVEQALAAYAEASDEPGAVPSVVLPRMMYGELSLGRPASAGEQLRTSVWDAPEQVDDHTVDLASWFREVAPPAVAAAFADAMNDLHQDHPGDITLARLAAASLPPDEAVAVLSELVHSQPHNDEVVQQLYDWLAADDPARVIDLAAELADRIPSRAINFADHAVDAIGFPPVAVRDLLDSVKTPSQALIASRLLASVNALGLAWSMCDTGLAQDPTHIGLLQHRIELAAALGEPELLGRALAATSESSSGEMWVARAKALRRLDQIVAAIEAATHATQLAEDNPAAWVELARAAAGQDGSTDAAIEAANRALALDPANEDAFEVLLAVYGANGPAPDAAKLQATGRRLLEAAPHSALVAIKSVEELLAQQKPQEALDRLTAAATRLPEDERLTQALVMLWTQTRQFAVAERWLARRMQERPHEQRYLRQLVAIRIAANRPIEAEQIALEQLADWPENPLGTQLLEVTSRALGRDLQADALARERIERRPPGIERAIQLGTLDEREGNTDRAVERLQPFLSRLPTLPTQTAMRIIAAVTQLDHEHDAATRLARDATQTYIESHPDAPLTIYAVAIVSRARLGESDESIIHLANDAVEHAADARASTLDTFTQYRSIVQTVTEIGRGQLGGDIAMLRLKHAEPRVPAMTGALAQIAQAAYIHDHAPERAIAVINLLESRNELSTLPLGADAPDLRAEAMYSAGVYATLINRPMIADDFFSRALERDPTHTMAANNLGYHRIDEGDSDPRYAAMIEQAHAAAPDDLNIIDTLAWLRYKQDRIDEPDAGTGALQLLEPAIEALRSAGNLNPEVLDHYGDILWRAQQHDRAANAWAQALALAESPDYVQEEVDGYRLFQERIWQIVLVDPDQIFASVTDPLVDGLRAKLAQVEAGDTPTIAQTFSEMLDAEGNTSASNAEADHFDGD